MRAERWVFWLLALIVVGSVPWRVHGWFPGGNENNDASIYILCAESLLRGEGYSYLGEPFTVRPPGFSLLLTPLIAWRGVDFLAIHTLVALLGALAVLAFYGWMQPKAGTWTAAAAALALHVHPAWQEWSTQAMTDVPGILALFGILLLDRRVRAQPTLRHEALLGACLGLSTYLRSTQWILLAALLAARGLERYPDGRSGRGSERAARMMALLGAALLVAAPWMVRDALQRSDGPSMQNFVHSYATGMLHEDAGDPASPSRDWTQVLTETAPVRLADITAELGSLLRGDSRQLWSLALGSLMLIAIAWRAWRDREAAWIFALLYLLVLLVYFGWRDRLLLPLLPLSMAAVVLSLGSRRKGLAAGFVMLVTGLALPAEAPDRVRLKQLDEARRAQIAAFDAVLPDSARCAALIGWHHSVGLQRPVYSLVFALRRGQTLDGLLAEERIDYVLVGPEAGEQALLPALRQRLGGGEPAGAGWVFRVPPR